MNLRLSSYIQKLFDNHDCTHFEIYKKITIKTYPNEIAKVNPKPRDGTNKPRYRDLKPSNLIISLITLIVELYFIGVLHLRPTKTIIKINRKNNNLKSGFSRIQRIYNSYSYI